MTAIGPAIGSSIVPAVGEAGGGGPGVITASISVVGQFFSALPTQNGFQVSTSGSGSGATFTFIVSGNVASSIVSVDTPGVGYQVGDTIVIDTVIQGSLIVNPVFLVDSVG